MNRNCTVCWQVTVMRYVSKGIELSDDSVMRICVIGVCYKTVENNS